MENITQLTLPLFDPPSFDLILKTTGAGKELEVVVNPRLRRGWQVKFRSFFKKRQLIIPRHLVDSPREVKEALIAWARLPCRPRKPQKSLIRRERAALEKIVWRYIESLPHAPRRVSRFDPLVFSGTTQGNCWDLREIFNAVNAAHFESKLTAIVRWGTPQSKTSYHTVKTGAHGEKTDCITIAGVYNHVEVPRFAIECLMHHEMLHIAIPPYKKNGRLVIHGKEFRSAEKQFPSYGEWRQWEKDVLVRLIRKRRFF